MKSYVLGYTAGNVAKRCHVTYQEAKRWIKKAIRSLGTCPFCLVPLQLGSFAVDHKDPICRGGSVALANCWLVCQPCNRAKGDLTVEEFHALRAFLTSQPNDYMKKSVLARLKIAGAMYRAM